MKLLWLIYGVVELYCMLCYVVACPLKIRKHQNFIKKYWQENIKFLNFYLQMLKIFLATYSIQTQQKDTQYNKFVNINGGVYQLLHQIFQME
jgi:hypothetical protein